MLRGSSILVLFLVFVAGFDLFDCETIEASANATKTTTTKRIRFTRRHTTPTTTSTSVDTAVEDENSKSIPIAALNESTDPKNDKTVDSIESSLVSGLPIISVDIASKKSLHVRNCGERIGDDVPFVVTLVHTNPFDKSTKRKRSLSKGVLISENFVLATVSSIYHSESFWTVSSVRLGDFVTWNKYANRDKSHTVEIEVDEIFYHKKKDLAMIKLKEAVEFTDVIRPACLPSSDYYNFKELQSHLCKRSQNRAPADVTLEFAAPLSMFDCKQFFARKQMTISQQEFCVWDESGDDCTGDIGSPLFTAHNGRLSVIGLRSYAESNEEFIDPKEYPAVYVKIGAFLDWISAVMNMDENKQEP